jgi:thioredoxin reductase (NADPH)
MSKIEKVLIIGSGPAGYTAAIYAARSGLDPLMVTGLEPGGQLMITTDVENYPGFENAIQGPWLMDQMKKQADSVGTRIEYDKVIKVDFNSFPFKSYTEKGKIIESYTTIISTGAKAKWLNVPGEEYFRGFGVSACATCDGFFFKNKEVAVVGGGNTAIEEAIFLSNLCKKVTVIHRRSELRAEKILQDRLMKRKNVEFLWNSSIKEILGNESPKEVTKIKVENKNISLNFLEVEGLFIAIGHKPATEIFKKSLTMDKEGYIFTESDSTKTKIDGVFAAGDVTDKIYRQAVTAAGMGCMSAIEAENFLNKKNII